MCVVYVAGLGFSLSIIKCSLFAPFCLFLDNNTFLLCFFCNVQHTHDEKENSLVHDVDDDDVLRRWM